MQLLQADSALRKPRRDVVQCGIYLNPQKYIEWHATCQTNIKCLQVGAVDVGIYVRP